MEIIDAGKERNVQIFSIKGRMDGVSAPEFEKKLGDLIDKGEKNFVIELGGLDYISSAGLRSILATAKKLKAQDGTIVLCRLRDMVKEVFEISGFIAIIPVTDSVEKALDLT